MQELVRWVARVLGTGLVVLVVVFAAGEGLPHLRSLTTPEAAQMGAMLAMLVGLLLAWRWPVLGGGIALFGWAAFEAVEWQKNAALALNWVFALFAVAALLHLVSAWPRAPQGAG